MAALGRSIAAGRALACLLGVASVGAPYVALRAMGVARAAALAGTILAMGTPWSAWTGVATVPEAPTTALIAAAAFACARPELLGWAAASALLATLSRYEAWPVAAVVAIACAMRRNWSALAVAALGPVAWIAWNAYAHGDAMHFLERVAAFRRSSGGTSAAPAQKLLGYPIALVRGAPEIAALCAFGALFIRKIRARWTWPLLCAAATVAFLVYGDVRDGAPTHHPERALLGVYWIAAALAADAMASALGAFRWRGTPRAPFVLAALWGAGAACAAHDVRVWNDHPGRDGDDRTAQVARGLGLRARTPGRLEVVPCAYEHFALIAAFGAPERVDIAPPTGPPVTVLCPRVRER
jgi:hypothetical protein